MRNKPVTSVVSLLLLVAFIASAQADVIRSQALINSIPVQGVTLSMTPQQAFEHLLRAGYRADSIGSFDEWRTGGIEFVRGQLASAEGESTVMLGRQPGRLINISESTNRPHGQRFDYQAEIAEVRRHFDISDDERSCSVNSARGAGVCSVSDGNAQQPFAYGIQVRATSRMIQLGYAFEMTRGPDEALIDVEQLQ